jgi:hypothetical protein
MLSEAACPSHRWSTPRWPRHLHVQRESTVANHPEIKSPDWSFGPQVAGENGTRTTSLTIFNCGRYELC